jgi:transposase
MKMNGEEPSEGTARKIGVERKLDSQVSTDVCPRCGEAADLALVKGCLRCLKCGFKWDCNGW